MAISLTIPSGSSNCGCCNQETCISLQYRSASQSCNPSSCGETPCTSTAAVYDDEGNCVSAAQVCSPNWADLTPAEKCAAKRYLTITTVDQSGGGNHGRTQVKQYTADDEGACDLETTCSGTVVTVTVETGEYTGPSGGGPTPACSSRTITGESEATTTETKTWNNDCTTTNEVACEGFSNTTDTCVPWGDYPTQTLECNTSWTKIDGSCQWQGFLDGDFEYNDNCLKWYTYELGSETTITPAPNCTVTTTYTNENEVGICTPPSFPAFPPFIDCTPEGQEPPDPPELSVGQGYLEQAYKYQNPHNPQSKSEQKVQFRVEHGRTGTCYLKVWFRKRKESWTYQAGANCASSWVSAGVTYEDDGTYEWDGRPSPCLADISKPGCSCENKVYSPVKSLTAGVNESVEIEFKFSTVPGVEPNWP